MGTYIMIPEIPLNCTRSIRVQESTGYDAVETAARAEMLGRQGGARAVPAPLRAGRRRTLFRIDPPPRDDSPGSASTTGRKCGVYRFQTSFRKLGNY